MKSIVLFLSLTFLYQFPMGQNSDQTTLQLEDIQGKWYIQMSNFPMWLSGKKQNPEFNYTIQEKKGSQVLLDEVKFEKKGKQKSITGYDKSVNATNTKYVWRGKGILAILKSKWEIIHLDAQEGWMLIYFEKTLFTPEGYDVVSRGKKLPDEVRENIDEVLRGIDPGLKLTDIPQG